MSSLEGRRRRQAPTGEWQYQGDNGSWYDEPEAGAAPPAGAPTPVPPVEYVEPRSSATPVGALMTILGSVVVGVATLLPWATESIGFVSISRNAFQLGDHESVTYVGPVLVVLAAVGVIIGTTRLAGVLLPRGMQASLVVLGVAIVLVIAFSYPTRPSGLSSSIAGVLVSFAVGFGFWLCLVGGAIIVLGGVVMLSKPNPEPPAGSSQARS